MIEEVHLMKTRSGMPNQEFSGIYRIRISNEILRIIRNPTKDKKYFITQQKKRGCLDCRDTLFMYHILLIS